jgi:predicted membrane chloride channel (bestrophin family)
MATNGKLLDSVVLSDVTIETTQAKMSANAAKLYMSFMTPTMLCNSAMATAISGATYITHSYIKFPITGDVLRMVHLVTGVVLGMVLTARIVMGVYLTYTATSQVYAFTKACRSLAVLSSSVSETLTSSAGAEAEKKGVGKFRFELVRLLNLAFYCYSLMLQGMRLAVPPSSLKCSRAEGEMLSAVDNPTVMVTKMISSLLEQQRAAKRISNEQVSVLMGKLCELIDAYHASLSLLLSPAPVSMTAFAYFFTTAWAYYTGAALAVIELAENTEFATFGLGLTLVYSAFLSLFVFGLYEAGNVVEAPLKAAVALLATEEMSHSLSDDLASLVDDDAVPVFLPK